MGEGRRSDDVSPPKAVDRREFLRSAPKMLLEGWRSLRRLGSERLAVIDIARCAAWGVGTCQSCYLQCPLRDEAMVLCEGKPIVVASACDGCGVCVEACRTVNDLGAVWLVTNPKGLAKKIREV